MIVGILFTVILGAATGTTMQTTPTGFSASVFQTQTECVEYYKGLDSFDLVDETTNFYSSAGKIMQFRTSWGMAWATCKEIS